MKTCMFPCFAPFSAHFAPQWPHLYSEKFPKFLTGVPISQCLQLASELAVPVFLYECAQEREYRRSLSAIRAGEYEGLPEKVCTYYTSSLIPRLSCN